MNADLIQRRANLTAPTYAQADFAQRVIAERLLARLDYMKYVPEVILDLACGCGRLQSELRQRYSKAKVLGLDFALARCHLLKQHQAPVICADAHAIALANQSIDMIISNDSWHWFAHPPLVLAECFRVMKPHGLLLFTTLGPDTLMELKQALKAHRWPSGVHDFLDMHDLGDLLIQTGFSDPVMDRELLSIEYLSVGQFIKDLKALGANYAQNKFRGGLLTPRRWQQIKTCLQPKANAPFHVTLELIQGQAWKIHPSQHSFLNEHGEVNVPIAQITSIRNR